MKHSNSLVNRSNEVQPHILPNQLFLKYTVYTVSILGNQGCNHLAAHAAGEPVLQRQEKDETAD